MPSRVARKPIPVPTGIEIKIDGQVLTVKSSKMTVNQNIHPAVKVEKVGNELHFPPTEGQDAIAGTMRALVNNLVEGLHKDFECKLVLVGVGYRAQVQGKKLVLTLGFSHPVDFVCPEEVKAETPSNTEIILKSFNKESLGRFAAKIRALRPPEPYKGKGVRYAKEVVKLKEVKKK